MGRPPQAGPQRGRGRGGRHGLSGPRQHARGLLGYDPSRQRPSQPMPPPSRKAPAEEPGSSSQPSPAQGEVQPPLVPVPLPPENKDPSPPPPASASSSPSSPHVMTSPPVSSDPVNPPRPMKNSQVVDVSRTDADAKRDDAQDDVSLVFLGSSSTAATGKKRLLPLDPPAPSMKKNSDVDVSMAHRDDALGLNAYLAKKRLLSTKACLADAQDADEEAKAAARTKTRLGWGQGLAKYENRSKKNGSKGHGGLDMAKMRVSKVTTTVPAFFKGSRRPLTGDLRGPENGSIGSLTENLVSPAQVPTGLSRKHSPSPAHDAHMSEGSSSNPYNSSFMSSSSMTAIAVSELPSSRGGDALDESSIEFTNVQDIPPQEVISECSNNTQHNPIMDGKIVIHLAQKPRNILDNNVLSDEEPETNKPETPETNEPETKEPEWSQEEKDVFSEQKPRNILDKNVLSDEEPETNEPETKEPEWSQEEKDVFSELITAFGMNFSKVSSFLKHKTTSDCMNYYYEQYISKCHKEAQNSLPATVIQSQENCCNENDAATVTATKINGRVKAEAEDVKKPVNQICHEPTANNLLEHSLPDKGHCESSIGQNEHVIGKNLIGESNAAPSLHGMRSSQAACLTISKTEAPELENFSEDGCSNEEVCITKSWFKVKENVPQSVLIANHCDEGNCVAGGPCGQDTVKIIFCPDEISAKLANGTIKGDQIRSGGTTPKLCSSLKEWKATEEKVASSNIDDGRKAPSDMKTPESKANPCTSSDPVMLTDPAFVEYMMKGEKELERRDSEQNDDKVKGKEGSNPVLCVGSKEHSGIQLSCRVNSQEIEKLDSIPSPEGKGLNADMENPTKESSPCVATNAAVVRDDLIQRLKGSEAMYTYSGGNEDKGESKAGNPVHIIDSKECSGTQFSCNVTAHHKGKGIIPSPEVNDLNATHMHISNGAPKSFHLPSISGSAGLDVVHADSSYVAMDIDLNIPLDVTPLDVTIVDLENSHADASMCPSDDSDATIEMEISSLSQSSTAVPQTAQKQPSNNQPSSIMLFGRVIYQSPSTGTTTHTPNQGNHNVVSSSSNVPSHAVVPVTRRSRLQLYPSGATWISDVKQQGQQAVLSNRMAYGGSTNGASTSAASPLQPGSSAALANMINQQRQQALLNITPRSIMRSGIPMASHHLIQGSGGSSGLINFNGFNPSQQQWPLPILDTSRVVVGYPFYYPGATANQAPATVATITSIGTNNGGEGASTSNTRAQPAAGRGRGRGNSSCSWLSLRRN